MLISAGLVIIQNNKICLVKPKGLAEGQYSIPKGLVDKNESILNAVIRETKEETGLIIPEGFISSKPHVLNYISQNGLTTKRVFYFIVNLDKKFIERNRNIDISEVEGFEFYDRNQAENLIYWKQLSVLNHLSPNRFSQKELRILGELNIIKKIKHPLYPIFLYNYTDKCKKIQFWNDTTLWCRGLVLDINGIVIARPFKKFFESYQLYNEFIPKDDKYKIIEKLDGALGILFFYNQKAIFCSRQSFKSKQALKASQILYNKYSKIIFDLDINNTYLFEIIYPNNRFVTNYGEIIDIFLLGMIDNESGDSLSKYNHFQNPKELIALCNTNKKIEGAILEYPDNFKVKVKYDFYKKLYEDISLIKKTIGKNRIYLTDNFEIANSIKVDFIKPFKIYNQQYLKLYIAVYRKDNELKEDEICKIISIKNVFPG